MSLSIGNETLLACDSYVNKNVKGVQLFWISFELCVATELLPSLLDNSTHCRITRALRKRAGSWNSASKFPVFLWKCAYYFEGEGEMLTVRLWFNWVDGGEGKRKANGKPLGRAAGAAWENSWGLFTLRPWRCLVSVLPWSKNLMMRWMSA